jgi:two-component system response regulator DegU
MGQGRIILVDKNPAALCGIRRLLEDEVESVLMVGDEISLFHVLENFSPDLVLADLSFPVSAKTNIGCEIKKGYPKIKVILLSLHDERSVVDEVMASGVEGFVLKRRAVIDLIPAIREVSQGGTYVSPDINASL